MEVKLRRPRRQSPPRKASRKRARKSPQRKVDRFTSTREKPATLSLPKVLLGVGLVASTVVGAAKFVPQNFETEAQQTTTLELSQPSLVELARDSHVPNYGTNNYGVQVVSTRALEKAEAAVLSLQKMGLKDVRVFERGSQGKVTYQVLAGNAESKAELKLTQELVRSHPDFQDAFPQSFSKTGDDLSSYLQVGAFSQADSAVQVATNLQERGYRNVFVRESDGLHRVQLGPFLRDQDAFSPQDKLKADGIENFIVRSAAAELQSLSPVATPSKAVFSPFVLSLKQSYSSREQAESQLDELKGKGFDEAFVMKNGTRFQVVVGAYTSQDEADAVVGQTSDFGTQLKWRRFYEGDYIAHGVNFSREPIPAKYFEGVHTSEVQVKRLLGRYDSWILREKIGGKPMVEVIMDVSKAEQVDPLILLSRIQTEMSGVETSARPSKKKLDWLTGHGATDSGRRAGHSGLGRQLVQSVRSLKEYYQSVSPADFPLLKEVDYGKKQLMIQDPVAYSLLQYTPHTVDTKLPTRGGGTYNAVKLFNKYAAAAS